MVLFRGGLIMAANKKSALIYVEWISIFEKLSDEEAGKLIKHFFRYVNDENPEAPDRLTELLFEPIKQQLKRDLKKYEAICERNRGNGSKGGRPKSEPIPNNPSEPSGFFTNPNNPDEPDKDKDKEEDKDKEKKKIEPSWKNTFDIYLDELNNAVNEICNDTEWIGEQEKYNPNVDIPATIRKSVAVYWGVETEGYANKKKTKGNNINWKTTFAKNMDKNKVYKPFKKVVDSSDIIFNASDKKSTEWKEI